MKRLVVYLHGKGGRAEEAAHYRPLFPESEVIREHPLRWKVPTHILYGEKDHLTSFETVSDFAEKTGATLEVMKGGEHWFHTDEQMEFLDDWIRCLK